MKQQDCPERAETRAHGEGWNTFGEPDVADAAAQAALAPFSKEERERLLRLRRHVVRGDRGEHYPVDKRQEFIRWLVDHGRLSDRATTPPVDPTTHQPN
jgi:hypothetical protein